MYNIVQIIVLRYFSSYFPNKLVTPEVEINNLGQTIYLSSVILICNWVEINYWTESLPTLFSSFIKIKPKLSQK